ncbi:hypothetical protein ACQP2P_43165 [Dactylosporangium sp. CA-139114]|uniref:hypothetical protein n=1 Tax=Dactylosporangium sp. CA-139114 TaxID=3239931 RepID=UPI003D96E57E
MSETTRPFQLLDQRLAGQPADETLYDDVPKWLVLPLRRWVADATNEDVARRVALRMRLSVKTPTQTYRSLIVNDRTNRELLTVVDAVLQLHPGWGWNYPHEETWGHLGWWVKQLVELETLLIDAGSLYRIEFDERCLIRRVDVVAEQAFEASVAAAPASASAHLRAAWSEAYGVSPDPDKSYGEAIRAVEEVACPLIEHKKAAANKATLGTVIGELRNNSGHKWELLLPGSDGRPQEVDQLVGMMELLWHGQVSRHGGGPKSRRQTQGEAEAAVHLATLLVQWLSAGFLIPKA